MSGKKSLMDPVNQISSSLPKVIRSLKDQILFPALGKKIPQDFQEPFTYEIKGKKSQDLGIKLTSLNAVAKVVRGCEADEFLRYGDLITHVNGRRVETRKQFVDVFHEICKTDYKLEIKGSRLAIRLAMETDRCPRGYDMMTGFKYHIAIMYMIIGCRLGLPVKSYNNKVFVTKIVENTLPSMCLSVGDAILDVDRQPVASVNDASAIIFSGLQKQGYVTMLIEQAEDPVAVQFVRNALMAEKTVEIDLPLVPDVIDICKLEIKRFKRNSDVKPKNILKTKSGKRRAKDSRIIVNEKTEDIPIACETNPNLLIKVPLQPPRPPGLLQQQQQAKAARKDEPSEKKAELKTQTTDK